MSKSGMNPLPSLIRASAWDAGNQSMRDAGRSTWSEDDYNASCDTRERLITACYARADDSDPRIKYIRFGIAGQLQAAGHFTLTSDFGEILEWIDEIIAGPAEQAA